MVSLWEQESLLRYNVIVIGAGISGLSTAASLKEKYPRLEVLVIERGSLPTGASTRNAGFACFGSLSELSADRKTLGDEGMLRLVSRRWQGLTKTLKRLGAERVEYAQKGGYELFNATTSHYLEQMDEVNELLGPLFSRSVFHLSDQWKSFGFERTTHMVSNPLEGQLHTGKLIHSLWQYCGELGVKIITGTEVKAVEETPDGIEVCTASHRFGASACAICTNAFTPALVEDALDLHPGRGLVLLVQPDKNLPFQGTFHYDEGFYYFRDFHGKLLFGGGRNLAMAEETTTEFGINERIAKKLHQDLQEIIIPDMNYQLVMQWSGIMAFGSTKEPIIKQLGSGLFLGVRLGGMGVALGSMIGEELADQIIARRF